MIENRISSYLYNELFSESNDKIYTTFQSMVWSVVAHKNTIKNCSTSLQAFPLRLCLCILYQRPLTIITKRSILGVAAVLDPPLLHFLFHKGKDTSAILQPSAQHLVYVFPIFINALITST